MHKNITKLQVPIDNDVLAAMKKHALSLGFDSTQAYIRFVGKAIADGRQVDLNNVEWSEPSAEAVERLNRWADEAERDSKAGRLKSFDDPIKALEYLNSL